jgi:hypothetical protein
MQVALNSDEEYDGGRLVFATSEGFVVPDRCTGSATIHTCSVAHGVTALTRGVRYGLFLSDTRGSTLKSLGMMGPSVAGPAGVRGDGGDAWSGVVFDSLKSLLVDATQMFDCYERWLKLLDSSSDEMLCVAFEDYVRHLSSITSLSSSSAAATHESLLNGKGNSDLSATLELFHHVHSLHPSVYPNLSLPLSTDVTYAQGKGSMTGITNDRTNGGGKDRGESLDLVKLSRRHVKFMRQLLEFRDSHSTLGEGDMCAVSLESILCASLQEYCLFLESLSVSVRGERGASAKEEYTVPVPSLLVDHLWHTHMSSPHRYSSDCVRICGHRVDHRVEEE